MRVFKLIVPILLVFLASCGSNDSESGNEIHLKKAPASLVTKWEGKKKSQSNKRQPMSLVQLTPGGPCDDAASVGVEMRTDFEFHRPKYDCKQGFWFCSETHFFKVCKDASGNIIHEEEIVGTTSSTSPLIGPKFVVDLVVYDDYTAVLAFKKADFEKYGYDSKDLNVFSVDEELEVVPGTGIRYKKGEYNSYEYNNLVLVEVPVYKI